jgi:chlorobactene glucosyltransferase
MVIYTTLAMLLGLFIAWWVHSRGGLKIVVRPETGQVKPTENLEFPLISVIVPARNEERNIRPCLHGILTQTYPNYEVIVVDDRSTDGTRLILEELATENARIRLVCGEELPAGWAGKPHALVQGTAVAHGEWLCFMDADTFASPELLSSTFTIAELCKADMFTILTRQILGSFWERTVLPLVFLGLAFGFPAEAVNDPSKPDAIANGQYILIKRSTYDNIGGHAAVKEHIDEDRALAAVVKRAGYRLVLADGRQVASTRMYTSLPEMWEGWTKNIYLGLRDKLGLLSFGAILGLLVSLVLPVWLAGGLAWLASGGGLTAAIVAGEAGVLWVYLLWERSQACGFFEIPGWYAFTFPLGAFIFTLMMLGSTIYVISGRGVSWKGRSYKGA